MKQLYLTLSTLCAFHISLCSKEKTNEKISTIFLNGIVDSYQQVERYKKADAITTQTTIASFADLQNPKDYSFNTALYYICNFFGKPVNRNSMFMGQEGDIQVAQETCNQEPNPFIIYGLSRGGAVAVSAAACKETQEIKALIIESAPYDIARPAYVAKCNLGIPFDHKKLFSYIFPAYDPNQPINAQAIASIENKEMPILIAHSQADSRVDLSESLRYYAHFKSQGFENVYFLQLPEGKHGYVITNPKSAPLYLQALHSFYKAHNLPHLEKHAQFNKEQLKKHFQPNVCDIKEEIQKDDQRLETIYQQAKTRNIISASLAALVTVGFYYFKI